VCYHPPHSQPSCESSQLHSMYLRAVHKPVTVDGMIRTDVLCNPALRVAAGSLLERLGTPEGQKGFTPQNLANLMWALATLEHSAPPLSKALVPLVLARLKEFNPQEMVNAVWAFAKIGEPAPTHSRASAAYTQPARAFIRLRRWMCRGAHAVVADPHHV
jgi:hypothetical protein